MPSGKAVSRGLIEFKYRENQLVVFLTEVHHPATHSLVECPGTKLDASQTAGGITKLCRKSGVDILQFSMFPVESANDHSLLELHEKWLNSKRTWFSLENSITLIDRQGGKIRSSRIEVDLRQ
jgi:hypothetical protein